MDFSQPMPLHSHFATMTYVNISNLSTSKSADQYISDPVINASYDINNLK